MRIGMLADIYKPYVSGVTSYISQSKRFLDAAGHEVFVFTFGHQYYRDDEINIYRSPGIPTFFEGHYLGFVYSTEIRQILQTMDVVHVHHPLISGRLALRYCRPMGIPILYTNHTRFDTYADIFTSGAAHQASLEIMKSYMEDFFNKVDLVVAPSEATKADLRQFGMPENAEVVPHGLDMTLFNANIPPAPRQEFGFSHDDVLVIYVGRLGPEKNLPLLLRSFHIAHQSFSRLRLLIVGGGLSRRSLENLVDELGIAEVVRFVGTIPYQELPAYYRMGDIFVITSPKETFGYSLVEAMACDLPVLALDTAWAREIVQPEVNGFLCREDPADFGSRLVELATEPDLRRRIGFNAQLASQNFSLANSMKTLTSLYARLIRMSKETARE